MDNKIKTVNFKTSPIEIEVKDLKFAKEFPRLLGSPHKATFNQIVWIKKGEAKFHIDFREITIKEEEILIISSGQVCQFDVRSDYEGKLILFTSAFFAISEVDSNFLYTSEILNPVSLNKTIPVCPILMDNLMLLLEEELKRPYSLSKTVIAQSLLRVILFESERQLTTSYVPVSNNTTRRFNNAVEQYFRENRNTEFYINLLGVNEKILSKEVKCMTGKTPKVYIDSRIVLEAKRLLSYSALSVKEIGFELGFDEPTNFNKYFRKHTSMTPVEFRDLMKNNMSGGNLPS